MFSRTGQTCTSALCCANARVLRALALRNAAAKIPASRMADSFIDDFRLILLLRQTCESGSVFRVHRHRSAHRAFLRNMMRFLIFLEERIRPREMMRNSPLGPHDFNYALARVRRGLFRPREPLI